ncbi:hypothetical protein HDV57DRAFT_492061 [Trichoderma longibrachiatum]|uniref:Uncharacterized protein n=1 Tax=Trichoderma longibrachiatum ATCC 18648 TaxID=983965 RepID=A0A2T4C2L7_TRILO|nr:hypothetical protein M440DRAFT_1402356 [Trichoderma longibrachiatum ATCC 18648]
MLSFTPARKFPAPSSSITQEHQMSTKQATPNVILSKEYTHLTFSKFSAIRLGMARLSTPQGSPHPSVVSSEPSPPPSRLHATAPMSSHAHSRFLLKSKKARKSLQVRMVSFITPASSIVCLCITT